MNAFPCLAVAAGLALTSGLALFAADHPRTDQVDAAKRPDTPDEIRFLTACQTGDAKVVGALLKLGLVPNAINQFDETPLHAAAFGSHAKIAALLLQAGADVEARNKAGDTPLRLAIQTILSRRSFLERGGYADATRTVEVLLNYGGAQVDPESQSIAEKNGLKDILALLRKNRKRESVKRPTQWRSVLQSGFIAKGTLAAPVKEMEAMMTSGKRDYVKLTLDVQEYLKAPGGGADRVANIQFYPKDNPPQPSLATVKALDGRQVLAFFYRNDAPVFGDGKFYLAGYSPESLQAFDEVVSAQIKEEMERQRRILETPEALYNPKRDPIYRKVKAVIARMVVPGEQHDAFLDLELLGPAAVPAIISLMDDRRPLPEKSMSLKNHSPEAFEGFRHYGPKTVIEALDAILNQLTGEPLGGIENGGSDEARRHAVAEWRVYLHYLLEKRRADTPRSIR
jgi:hypothetical protein